MFDILYQHKCIEIAFPILISSPFQPTNEQIIEMITHIFVVVL